MRGRADRLRVRDPEEVPEETSTMDEAVIPIDPRRRFDRGAGPW